MVMNALATVSAVMSVMGTASGHCVNWSTHVNTYPKVIMLEPLTAWQGEVPWLVECSVLESGTMLTSAPVSTRNHRE